MLALKSWIVCFVLVVSVFAQDKEKQSGSTQGTSNQEESAFKPDITSKRGISDLFNVDDGSAKNAPKRTELQAPLKPPFFAFPPIRVPVIQKGVWVADLFCKLECEVQDIKDYDKVMALMPDLVDAVYTAFYIMLGERFILKTPLEVDVWRPIVHSAVGAYFPVKNIYFRQFCLVEYEGGETKSVLRTR